MVVPVKHALHMFQQNRYEAKRMIDWMKLEVKRNLIVKNSVPGILLVCGFILSFLKTPGIVVMSVLTLLLALAMIRVERDKEYIKPLVLTARVKRQILAMVVLNVVWMVGFLLLPIPCFMPFIAYYINWGLLFVMHAIMTPVEEGIKKGYFNEAKRILDEDTRLIKIGITGSYGKTSSKNILQEILSEKYYSLMTPASYNTPMGITRTVREMLKPVHEVFVCEMGADKVGDIQELTDFVHPTIGLVTSIGPQHLSTFKTMDNIIKEKMKMIENLPANGIGIINKDNEFIRNYQVKNKCKLVSYGIHEPADYFGANIQFTSRGSKFDVVYGDESYPFETKLLGEHNIQNILAAIAIARSLGVSWKELQAAVKKVKYVEHRMEIKVINGFTFIDDAFNSNPVGSALALECMSRMEPKRWVVTPGMIELGDKEYELNKAFGSKMKGCVDAAILVGVEQTKAIYEGLQEAGFDMNEVYVVATVKEAFRLVYTKASTKDTILLENDLPDAFNV